MFKTAIASAAGLGLLVVGTGLTGAQAAFVLGLGLFAYNVAVLASLALRDVILRLAELSDAWIAWEPIRPSSVNVRSTNQTLGRI